MDWSRQPLLLTGHGDGTDPQFVAVLDRFPVPEPGARVFDEDEYPRPVLPHACSLEHLIWLPDPAQRGEARAAEVELMAEWLVSNFGFGYVRPLPSGSDREVAFLPSALTDQK